MSEQLASKELFGLVIEDDYDAAFVLRKALTRAGLKTEIVTDGAEALIRLASVVPDFITLDMHLPHTPGPEVLRRIRQDPRLANVLVMVLTADAQMAEGAVAEMATVVLLKPFTYEQVRDLTKRLLTTIVPS